MSRFIVCIIWGGFCGLVFKNLAVVLLSALIGNILIQGAMIYSPYKYVKIFGKRIDI